MSSPAPTGEVVPPDPSPAPPWSERTTLLVGLVAAGAAFLAGVAGCTPTGAHATDVTLSALLAAAVVGLGARARPLALAAAAVVALVAGETVGLRALAGSALAVALLLTLVPSSRDGHPQGSSGPTRAAVSWGAVLGALAAGMIVQVLLRLPATEPARMTAVVAAVGLAPILWSGWRGLALGGRRLAGRALVGAGVVSAVGLVAGTVAGLVAAASLRAGVDHSQDGLDAIRAGEKDRAGEDFRAAGDDMHRAQEVTGAWWALPARHIPLVAPQLAALDTIARGGAETAALAAEGADRIDDEGLQLVDGRIDPEAVAAVEPVLDDVVAETARLRRQLDGGAGASVWQIPPVADGVARFEAQLADAEGSARTGALAAEIGPALLGAGGEARYFVAFVTPSEARGTGFLGSYGLLTATDGRLDLVEVGRNKALNAAGSPAKDITGPPDYLARYSRFEPQSTWENVTFTPDGPTAAEVMAELYPQSGGTEVDGVLRIDPAGVARLLRVTGPVTVEGVPYALDATNVEHFLLVEQYRALRDRDARVDVLGRVAAEVFDALTRGEEVAPARLARALGPAVRGGNITLWLRSAEGTRLVDRLGVTGAVPPVRGDGFGVVTNNAGGNKVDAFLQRTIRYDAEVDATTGEVHATAEVDLANTAPTSGEPPYLIGNLVDQPPGTNRMYLSAYSPLDLVSAELDGASVTLEEGWELGRHVWSAFIDVPAGATATLTLELAGTVDLSDGTYRFALLPQVMARPDRARVTVEVTGGAVEGATTTARAADGDDLDAEVTGDGVVDLDVPAVHGPFAVAVEVRRRSR